MGDSADPVTAITGGTSGIGLAIARRLVQRGHRLALLGLADRFMDAARAEFAGQPVLLVAGDVADPASSEELVERAVGRWGPLSGLVACAAARATGAVTETTVAAWERTIAVNLSGVFYACRAALASMSGTGGGSLVVIGSASGYGGEGHAAYATSKGALFSLALSMALDHRRDHIRVNVVAPGTTRTPMNAGLREPHVEAAIAARSSVTGDLSTADDVAAVVAFLLSDDARAISGAIIDVGYFHGEPFRQVEAVRQVEPGADGRDGR